MIILDGKAVAKFRTEILKKETEDFKKQWGEVPHLVVLLVGENSASQVYVRNKIKACEMIGMKSSLIQLEASISQNELNECIQKLNQDSSVDGILVQLPLPRPLNENFINENLSIYKDVDGFTYLSMGHLWEGKPYAVPCTPLGIMHILDYYKISVEGKYAVVVGRSHIVGKPMAHLLTQANATVTLCHSKTIDLRRFTQEADIVIVAAGKKHLLGREDFKKGAVVIDVGMHGSGSANSGASQLAGDVRFIELEGWAAAASPVPGGVGPMTISTLLENTLKLAKLRRTKGASL